MKCPICQYDNDPYNVFCVFCGEQLSSGYKPTEEELARQYQNKSKSELMNIAININKGWTVDAVETAKYILKSKYNEEIQEIVKPSYVLTERTRSRLAKASYILGIISIVLLAVVWFVSFVFLGLLLLSSILAIIMGIMVRADKKQNLKDKTKALAGLTCGSITILSIIIVLIIFMITTPNWL
jgi:hypothetical protein